MTMTTKTKKAPRKRTPPPPPCLCLECKREGCMGIGKPFMCEPLPNLSTILTDLDLKPLDLPNFGKLSFELGTFDTGDDAGPAPAAARLAIAKAIIRNADAGRKIPPRVVKMARAEVERQS